MEALNVIFRPGYKYKKVGITARELVPQDTVQAGLFDRVDRKRDQTLMGSIDRINKHFGDSLVKFAIQGTEKKWKLRQLQLSPCYTTRLTDIKIINI
jgi:DNA polymerase V